MEALGNDPYENLIIGIIRQATVDYKSAVKKLKENENNEKALGMKRQCEKFLKNDLEMYEPLVSVSGDYILQRLNKKAHDFSRWDELNK